MARIENGRGIRGSVCQEAPREERAINITPRVAAVIVLFEQLVQGMRAKRERSKTAANYTMPQVRRDAEKHGYSLNQWLIEIANRERCKSA